MMVTLFIKVNSFRPTNFIHIKELTVPKNLKNEWKQLLFKMIFLVWTKVDKMSVERIEHFLTVCSCHVPYAFQSESTLYSCLNVKELLARSRREIWRWSDCNWTRTQNSVRLRTKWFCLRVQLQLKVTLKVIKVWD